MFKLNNIIKECNGFNILYKIQIMIKKIYKFLFVFLFVFISNISKAEDNLELILKKANQKEEVKNTGIYKNIKIPNGVGIVNNNGKVIFKGDYDDIKSLGIKINALNSIHNKFFTFSLNGKEGLIDETARIIVKPKYDKITDVLPDKDSYCFKFIQNNKLGIFDFYGKEILAPNYDHIESVRHNNEINSFFVGNKGIYSLFNKKTKKIILTNIMDFKGIGFNLFKITIKNKSGVIDSTGKFIVKPIYDEVCLLENSNFIIYGKNNKYGLIAVNGKIITKSIFDDIRVLNISNLIKYKIGNKYGLINQYGKVIQKAVFDDIGYINYFDTIPYYFEKNTYESNIPVLINNKWGFVNHLGNIIIKPRFDKVLNFYNGLGYVGIKKSNLELSKRKKIYNLRFYYKWGVINKFGKWIIKPEFDIIKEFSEGLAFAIKDRKTGFIDTRGNFVFTKDVGNEYVDLSLNEEFYYFKENFTSIHNFKYDYYHLIDSSGKEYLKYENASVYFPRLNYPNIPDSIIKESREQKNKKQIFVNPSKFLFDRIDFINKDYIQVTYNNLQGLVNRKNNFIVKPLYKDFEIIKNKYNNKNYYIFLSDNNGNSKIFDENLKLILDYKFDHINENGVGFTIDSEDKLGLLDKNFNVLLKPTFSRIGNFNNSIAYVSITGNYSYINEKGQLLLDLKYKNTDDYSGNVAWVKDGTNYLLISKKQDIILKNIIKHENFENKLSIFYYTNE